MEGDGASTEITVEAQILTVRSPAAETPAAAIEHK